MCTYHTSWFFQTLVIDEKSWIWKQTSGDSGANVKRLEQETDAKIEQLKNEASRISRDVVDMLLKNVTTVNNWVYHKETIDCKMVWSVFFFWVDSFIPFSYCFFVDHRFVCCYWISICVLNCCIHLSRSCLQLLCS